MIEAINDKDHIFVFQEIINNIEARLIMDIGMFYARIGSVAINWIGQDDVKLHGINAGLVEGLGVVNKVYDRIYDIGEYIECDDKAMYDLVTLFDVPEAFDQKQLRRCLMKLSAISHGILMPKKIFDMYSNDIKPKKTVALSSGDNEYVLEVM